jgi:ParB-like chromosome segregation protein Spo0J
MMKGDPMPSLDPLSFEALTESVAEFGVITPVVKDQTGYVLDGKNRMAIAKKLNVDFPEVFYECAAEQRDVLRIELNGNRRQRIEDWKPICDHLRSKGHSDRSIARALGLTQSVVHRYKVPQLADDSTASSASSQSSSVLTADGKVRHHNEEWTANARALYLIQHSEAGMTANELHRDPVLAQFSSSSVDRVGGHLAEQGLVERAGKRGRQQVWCAVQNAEPKPAPKPQSRDEPNAPTKAQIQKAEKLIALSFEPGILSVAQGFAKDEKEAIRLARQHEALMRSFDAAEAAAAKRQAETDKAALREAGAVRDAFLKGNDVEHWTETLKALKKAGEVIAILTRDFDEIPSPRQAHRRMLDTELNQLKMLIRHIELRLHPEGKNPLKEGEVIDAEVISIR